MFVYNEENVKRKKTNGALERGRWLPLTLHSRPNVILVKSHDGFHRGASSAKPYAPRGKPRVEKGTARTRLAARLD